jgi:cell division protein FtsB
MGMTKALAQEVNQSITTMKDETLERTNKKLLQKQKRLEYELQSCTTDNHTLRQCLLSHVSDVSAKEQTYAFALSQLNSLSNCHYELLQSLNYEKHERKAEVTTLQLKLDNMSRQMVQLRKQVHDLQSENDMLKYKRRKQRLEEQ